MSSPIPGSDPNSPQGSQPGWGTPQDSAQGYGTQGPTPGYGAQSGPQGDGTPGYGTPGYGTPGYGTPGYGTPAPSYSGAPAGTGGAAGKRPGQVTAAAIIGVVIGGLGTLGGLLTLFAIGAVFEVDAVLGVLALLSLAAAVVLLVGGIQVLRDQSPRLLLMGSYASIVLQLLYLVWALLSDQGFSYSSLLGCILPILIVVLLRSPQAKQYFGARGLSY